MKKIKLAFLGFGSAGQATVKLLKEKEKEILERYSLEVVTTAIATGSRGNLENSEGIDIIEACNQIKTKGKFKEGRKDLSSKSSFEIARKSDYDILVEITPLEIFSGQPAIDHIKEALKRGKHVVTANKGPIAWAYEELKNMAEEKGSKFFFETAVMDGTPIFNLVEDTLKFCKVLAIEGILNSTTNYILEEMEKGTAYEKIIETGKEKGFIEANPAMDVEGYDAAAKVTALLNVLMNAKTTPDKIIRQGIEKINEDDIKKARAKGQKVKLVCKGFVENGKVIGKVEPMYIDKNKLLANVDGTSSMVSIKTDLMGTISIIEQDPEIEQTAYGIFGDIIRVIEKGEFTK